MATSRDNPNPLRPYYIPPSIGPPPEQIAHGISAASKASASSYPSSSLKSSFGSTARDYLSDIDYGDYLSDGSPSMTDMAKRVMDQAMWNYTTVLLAQPFEVAKTVLQVHLAAGLDSRPSSSLERSRPSSYASGKFEDYPSDEDDSDEEDASYFTSNAPHYEAESSRHQERGRQRPNRSHSSTPTPANPRAPQKIELKRPDGLLEVLTQIYQKEGGFALWKGTNSTFVYNFLLKTIESWTRSMLSALLNVPDPGLLGSLGSGPGGLDIVDSPNPIASLIVAVAAAGVAGVVLSPMDTVRTRVLLQPITSSPRNVVPLLRTLRSFTVPTEILPITLIHSTLPTLFSASTPLFLRSWFNIDPVLTPGTFSIATFLSSATELFLRLPLETVLRRGQVEVLKAAERENEREYYNEFATQRGHHGPEKFRTIVDVGPYKGVLGTMWFIVREEGVSVVGPVSAAAAHAKGRSDSQRTLGRVRKGQGVFGLWRGWRVGFWGIVGVWGAAAFGTNAGGEF